MIFLYLEFGKAGYTDVHSVAKHSKSSVSILSPFMQQEYVFAVVKVTWVASSLLLLGQVTGMTHISSLDKDSVLWFQLLKARHITGLCLCICFYLYFYASHVFIFW